MKRLTPFVVEIYEINLADTINLNGIHDEIRQIRETDDGISRSNVGGYHSKPFLPVASQPHLTRLAAVTTGFVSEIAVELGLGTLRPNGSWINISEPGDRNDWHYHQFTALSTVFYLAVPEGSGDLRIERPDIATHYWRRAASDDPRTRTTFSYRPKSGDLVIFPAYLRHDVEQNRSNEARISIASNYAY